MKVKAWDWYTLERIHLKRNWLFHSILGPKYTLFWWLLEWMNIRLVNYFKQHLLYKWELRRLRASVKDPWSYKVGPLTLQTPSRYSSPWLEFKFVPRPSLVSKVCLFGILESSVYFFSWFLYLLQHEQERASGVRIWRVNSLVIALLSFHFPLINSVN